MIYHGKTLGTPFYVPINNIAYASILLAIIVSVILCLFMVRRLAFKGELGGKSIVEKNVFGFLMILIWILFVILLSLRSLGYI